MCLAVHERCSFGTKTSGHDRRSNIYLARKSGPGILMEIKLRLKFQAVFASYKKPLLL